MTGLDEIGRGCSKLTKLDVSRTGVTDLSEIGRGCPDLESLNITNSGVTDLSEIGRGCPDLESLNITNSGVTALGEIARGCPKLTSLFGSESVDPEHLLKILRDGSFSTSSKVFEEISQSLSFECVSAHDSLCFTRAPRSARPHAVTLPHSLCDRRRPRDTLTDEMLSEIIAYFPNITKLYLRCVAAVSLLLLRRAHPCSRARSRGRHRDCEKLTQKSIGTIGRGCPDLEDLNLAYVACTDISEIARSCRKLKSLDVQCVAPAPLRFSLSRTLSALPSFCNLLRPSRAAFIPVPASS